MAKPSPLQNVASEVSKSLDKAVPTPMPVPSPAPEPVKELAREPEPPPIKPTGSKTSREGKKFLGYYVEPRRHEEIKEAAAEEGIKIQDLMRIAIDEWMDRNGQEAVAVIAARHGRRSKRSG